MNAKRRESFTLVEIMIVVAIIAVIAALAFPSFIKSRQTARQNSCINNLWQIDSAKEQAALTFKWQANSLPTTTVVNSYIKGNTTPLCPSSGIYTYEAIGTNPVCSIVSPTSHRIMMQ